MAMSHQARIHRSLSEVSARRVITCQKDMCCFKAHRANNHSCGAVMYAGCGVVRWEWSIPISTPPILYHNL